MDFLIILSKTVLSSINVGSAQGQKTKVFRWGEDDHYYTDAEYERNELLKEKEDTDRLKNLQPLKLL